MNESILTHSSTMTNPESLQTVPELRAELKRTQSLLVEATEYLHRLSDAAQGLGQTLSGLVLAHMESQPDKVKRLLDEIVDCHVVVVDKSKGGLH